MPCVMYLKYLKITGYGFDSQGKFEYAVCLEAEKTICPHCKGESLYAHGYRYRNLSLMGRDGARKRIRLRQRRFKCRCCGRTFMQDCSRIGVGKWQRRNARLNDAISRECANGVSNKQIAQKYRMNASTVERQLHRNHEQLLREQLTYPCPMVMGIDEHSIHRGRTKGAKFAVTLTDLRHRRVYEIFEDKNSRTLEANLRRLKGREKVKVVCMDLSSPFRNLVQRLFPNAKIVADRFHVIKLVISTFHEFCKAEDPDIRWKRGITCALRTKGKNLTAKQNQLLQKEFEQHPAIQTAHEFKEELCALLSIKEQKRKACIPLLEKLKEMVWLLLHDAPEIFKKLGLFCNNCGMSPARKKRSRRKVLVKDRKTLSMEEITPTMPCVMYLKYLKITGYGFDSQGKFEYAVCLEAEKTICPHCKGESLYAHGYRYRNLSLMGRDGARKRIRLRQRRFKCRCCGRTFMQDCSRIGVGKWQRRNARLNDAISRECANGVSNKQIAQKYRMNASTVERQLHRNHEQLLREQLTYPCPMVMGIDEHSIHRGRTKGAKFAVTLTDLRHRRVYEIFEDKNSRTLEANLRRLKGREKVKVVCMDLSSPFRNLVQRLFPNAKIVADRFHVIKLVISTFHEFCKAEDPDIRWKRGITCALRTKGKNLTAKQNQLLQKEFEQHPAIQTAHEFKEELCALLSIKEQKRKACIPLLEKLKEMVWLLLHDAPEIFKKLGRTIRQWFEPIIRMWRFTKSNGITEGFHRKMKLIQRRAYGYRNFQNYRLRVLIECGHIVI